jgi:hypothetical protein
MVGASLWPSTGVLSWREQRQEALLHLMASPALQIEPSAGQCLTKRETTSGLGFECRADLLPVQVQEGLDQSDAEEAKDVIVRGVLTKDNEHVEGGNRFPIDHEVLEAEHLIGLRAVRWPRAQEVEAVLRVFVGFLKRGGGGEEPHDSLGGDVGSRILLMAITSAHPSSLPPGCVEEALLGGAAKGLRATAFRAERTV